MMTYQAAINVRTQFVRTVFRANSLMAKADDDPAAQGAGVEFEHQLGATNLSLLVDGCTFESNLAEAPHGFAVGGGLDLPMGGLGGEFVGVEVRMVRTRFTNNTLSAGGEGGQAADGAGAKLIYQDSARVASVRHELIECAFESNRALATGSGGLAYGGGLDVEVIDVQVIAGFVTLIADSTFKANQAAVDPRAGGGTDSYGGGLYVAIGDTGITRAASGVRTIVRTSRFIANAGGDGGAGAHIVSDGTAVGPWLTLLEQCTFDGNYLTYAGSYGGAICSRAVDTLGTSLTVRGCTIRNNRAGAQGGGIWAVQVCVCARVWGR